ncbi:MAG: LPS export ABC transporter periplasmic protein LptC [Vampirovibrionales bacterium]
MARFWLSVLCVGYALTVLTGCRPASLDKTSSSTIPPEDTTVHTDDKGIKRFPVKAQGLSFQITKPTGDTWKLLAKQAVLNADQSKADLQYVSGIIYNVSHQAVGTFESKTGTYYPKTQAVTLRQSVVLRSTAKHITLQSQTLDFNAKAQWVEAYGGVTITYPSKATLTGARVSFDTDFQQVTLTGGATTALVI